MTSLSEVVVIVSGVSRERAGVLLKLLVTLKKLRIVITKTTSKNSGNAIVFQTSFIVAS